MGTRNLTMVVYKGELKVAQYGQWDGYLTGAGIDIAKFIKKLKNRKVNNQFKNNVSECTWLTDKQMIEINNSGEFPDGMYSYLSRDVGRDILNVILYNGPMELSNQYQFLSDKLFCEYAYLINLDNRTVTIYKNGLDIFKILKFKDFTVEKLKQLESKGE